MSITFSDEEIAMLCESIERDKAEIRQLSARLEKLKEAVEWERKCCPFARSSARWAALIQDAARAEVDRLLGEK